ncbi:hypothetical protein [Variovorax paradoxus]|uniref:Cupin 2 conserved barrel domain-containing protein n=1 Tax=Variovorax paradoxus TaxID=34073 RepID=A0A0H2M5W3_VARPD|nr:hypothetical protein [Variovorax paradoxus]KLN57758.1 hypothetical protein VPARA_12710 [Variovorax paradoxus]
MALHHASSGQVVALGTLDVQFDGGVKLLEADQVMYLAGGVPHGLHALEDTRLLMAVVLPASRTD